MTELSAKLLSIQPLTDSIMQLMLEPEHYIDYLPGQYLQFAYQGEWLSYSIANAPLGAKCYELHIRHSLDNQQSHGLIHEIRKTDKLQIRLPFGNCHLDKLAKELPILFIAGGTGFAPIKAMIEALLANADGRHFELFWGARSESDLYMDDKVNYWQAHVERFRYVSCLSSRDKSSLVELVIKRHSTNLSRWQIVISGPFDMVYNTRDKLVENGVRAERLYSDAFDFEEKKEN